MQVTEWLPSLAALTALAVAISGIVVNRHKPVVDTAVATATTATATKTTYEVDVIKAEVRRISDQENLRRDLRVLDLERWADQMRPAMRTRDDRLDVLCRIVAEDHVALGRPAPELPPLPAWPEFPEPRPMPA